MEQPLKARTFTAPYEKHPFIRFRAHPSGLLEVQMLMAGEKGINSWHGIFLTVDEWPPLLEALAQAQRFYTNASRAQARQAIDNARKRGRTQGRSEILSVAEDTRS